MERQRKGTGGTNVHNWGLRTLDKGAWLLTVPVPSLQGRGREEAAGKDRTGISLISLHLGKIETEEHQKLKLYVNIH